MSINQGRTVLFVSHSMPTISSLCNKSILLGNGKIIVNSETSKAILLYYKSGMVSTTYIDYSKYEKCPGDDYAQLLKFYVL